MKPTKIALDKAAILIADADHMMAEVLRQALKGMGLTNITRAKSSDEVLGLVVQKHFDILITEWNMKPLNGLELIKIIRRKEETKIALLPVIMLTAQAEKFDVTQSRDAGVTEFLVKPFTAQSIFDRLEHIIDFPRDFIVAKEFVGHDRRRHKNKAETEEDKRKRLPAIVVNPKTLEHVSDSQTPYRVIPTHALKKKMGIAGKLSSIITPEVLEKAQTKIEAFQEESLTWIAQDLAALELALHDIGTPNTEIDIEKAKECLLSIKARAGTFGFMLASDVAFTFYQFLRKKFVFNHPQHIVIVQKHFEVLKVILSRQVKGVGGIVDQELVDGIALLTQKLQDTD